ncbi:MAG: hypothetical protein LQ352_002262 [Teloschistes flavicans]|nr:MAG: hypothetical protein LQ352_002262 [Teloschistes flavicans]
MALNFSPATPVVEALPDRTVKNDDSHEDTSQHKHPQVPVADSSVEDAQPPAVRFASVNQEIEPAQPILSSSTQDSGQARLQAQLSSEEKTDLRSINFGIQNSQLQQRRMSNFAFEPVSLPVSRAPSNDESSPYSTRQPTRSTNPSPMLTPRESDVSVSSQTEDDARHQSNVSGADLAKAHADPARMGPGTLLRPEAPAAAVPEAPLDSSQPPSTPTTRPSSASDHTSTRPTTLSQGSSMAEAFSKQAASSREGSPSRTTGTSSGTATPPGAYARPFTPRGNEDDPYARNKRRPQSKNLDAIDARFVFESKDTRRRSAMPSGSIGSSSGTPPRSSSGIDVRNQDKRQSTFSLHGVGGKKEDHGHRKDEGAIGVGGKHHHGSMSDLKRFFGIGHHKGKRAQSPSAPGKKQVNNTGYKTPPHLASTANIPFADDHGLATKYGKFGKVLGSGAGGSVRLMKRSSDGVTFAVKQFRDRHSYETEKEYSKKVTAEFCIGSTLHHGNIIEALDIVHEKGRWYEVMEYAPFDLFAIVMTGEMSREEIGCSFLQIVCGVVYLHSMGLAHRDLKLDNVVVNEHGIMKLIDFGSAAVFRYPFETDIVLASGIVGSDPYLAPEVYDSSKYDPQPADIWSLAIIFACMSLRRFPWKAPRLTDNSYKLFVSPPTPGTLFSDGRVKSTIEISPPAEDSRRSVAPSTKTEGQDSSSEHSHHHHHHRRKSGSHEDPTASGQNQRPQTTPHQDSAKPEVIKGPWRLLRLLPRESRSIIDRMLEVNPKRRATLEEMMTDPWISSTSVCSQVVGGQIVRAPGHQHTLEPGSTVQSAEA